MTSRSSRMGNAEGAMNDAYDALDRARKRRHQAEGLLASANAEVDLMRRVVEHRRKEFHEAAGLINDYAPRDWDEYEDSHPMK